MALGGLCLAFYILGKALKTEVGPNSSISSNIYSQKLNFSSATRSESANFKMTDLYHIINIGVRRHSDRVYVPTQ